MTDKSIHLDDRELEAVAGGASRGDNQAAAYQPHYQGGVHVAAGDINGDAPPAKIVFSDLIVSSYQVGGSHGDS
ncbi:hypothetical protein [Parasphingopyxis marina]|uniref:Bacteriocin n=1 Tax=Parasphingopyxis marina TaxID=2761622 RepID=A0A842HWJ6_9SPHN|nr:hypothetical protein [Parasphingopyxis marina]MBC2776787.1 hypothetical protein [Parasphingopyxis marina]